MKKGAMTLAMLVFVTACSETQDMFDKTTQEPPTRTMQGVVMEVTDIPYAQDNADGTSRA